MRIKKAELKDVNFTIRTTEKNYKKLIDLAERAGVSRTVVIEKLIERVK